MASNNPFEGVMNLLHSTSAQDQVSSRLQTITDQLADLKSSSDDANRTSTANDIPTVASASSGSNVLETIGGFLGGGLGLFPLVSGLASLFGSDGDTGEAAASLARYAPPASLRVNTGFSNGIAETFAVDAAQGGIPRALSQATAPQVVVNVSAMDSKSFLDHSDDIARAVRQAMLESTVLNDVIREV